MAVIGTRAERRAEACVYLESFGIDAMHVTEGGHDYDGYETLIIRNGERVTTRHNWPEGFEYLRLLDILHNGKRMVGASDNVNHPRHYTADPSGVECIQITRHRSFCIGNAIKYLWRAGLKEDAGRDSLDKQVEDLEKAVWYIQAEIKLLREGKQ